MAERSEVDRGSIIKSSVYQTSDNNPVYKRTLSRLVTLGTLPQGRAFKGCDNILLNFILALVLFLFGMNVISTGFFNIAQSKASCFIERAGSTPLRGILIGTAVTAILQSSSAVTVMLVGAVDSGIIKLKSAFYIIMGANIGTSVTAWIIALSGIKSGINPVRLYPVAGLIGIALIILCKKIKMQNLGMVMVGFTLIMTGIKSMSSALEPLELSGIINDFKSPLLGIFGGAITSAVTQSSSAGIGILQALSAAGSVTLRSAVPIILGQNIGTCVTAGLASIGAGKSAKKVAAAHLMFNVSGVIVWTILFYIFRGVMPDCAIGSTGIALIHTLFNMSSTAIVLPIIVKR